MVKVNITLEIEEEYVTHLESYLGANFTLKDYCIVPDTTELYNNDKAYKKLCDDVKKAKLERDRYRLTK